MSPLRISTGEFGRKPIEIAGKSIDELLLLSKNTADVPNVYDRLDYALVARALALQMDVVPDYAAALEASRQAAKLYDKAGMEPENPWYAAADEARMALHALAKNYIPDDREAV